MKTYYVIALCENEILTLKLHYTNELMKVKRFATFEDAIDFEELQGDKIKGLTDIYKVDGLKFTKET